MSSQETAQIDTSATGATSSEAVSISNHEPLQICSALPLSEDTPGSYMTAQRPLLDQQHPQPNLQDKQSHQRGPEDCMEIDDLSQGVSRLSVAAAESAVPESFSFGKGRGRGRMSRRRGASRRGFGV